MDFTAVSWQFNDPLGRVDNVCWMGYGLPFSVRTKEIKIIIGSVRHTGNVPINAGQIQAILERDGKTYKRDYPATRYVVEYHLSGIRVDAFSRLRGI